MLAHGCVEGFFSGVPERRMAEIVDQGERFDEIGVESELGGDGAGDLRDLDSVRQAVAEVIGVTASEHLSLRFEASKRAGMDDAITIALKIVAIGVRRLGMAASAGIFYANGIVGQHGESLAAHRKLLLEGERFPSCARLGRTNASAATRELFGAFFSCQFHLGGV